MDAFRSQAAPSSMSRFAYHLFLSFRGQDTRKDFTDHLYTALLNSGIRTFRDDDELQRGENIEIQLQEAIEGSKIMMVVLSKDYASSRWCLDELVKILECKNRYGRVVLPIFYHVDRSQVREQTGSYREAFERHKERYTMEINERKKAWMERIDGWRAALTEVADMEGTVFQNRPDGHESKFIQEIVKETGKILNCTIFRVAAYPVGIDSRVEKINLWLQDGLDNVGIFVIYGVGGIGKTTIAKTVYNLNYDKFDGSSLLANIREASGNPYGLARLQRQFLSDITKKRMRKIYNVDEGIIKIRDAVYRKRILLVLDDVDDLDQLDAVFGMREWFYSGSKIIITTRHERLLKDHDVYEMYKVKPLDEKESLRLFCWHAFRQDLPQESFAKLSRSVVYHCDGLPLALQVLGSSLSGRNEIVWESALKKLRAIPDSHILTKLRISFDNLADYHDQNLFLDITCFFIGKDKDYVVTILDHDFFTMVGIQNLVDRCLLTIDSENKLRMHQLLRDMGREVIRQESPERPGKRSRLWRLKDSFNVLKEKSGMETVVGFVLDMQKVKEVKVNAAKQTHSEENRDKLVMTNQRHSVKGRHVGFFGLKNDPIFSNNVSFEIDAFARMQKLRLLQLSYVQLDGSYEKFPKRLRCLSWRGFPSKFIPNDFPMECLVALDMRNSNLEHVWRGRKLLTLLKVLNLSHSHGLRRTPDFSGLPNLKMLILKYCIRLAELHESVEDLERLVLLNLRGCKNLRNLPRGVGKLKSLEKLIITGCTRLKLPVELGKLESLEELRASGIDLNEFVYTRAEVRSWPSLFFSWALKRRKSQQPINFLLSSLSHSLRNLCLANCNLSDDAITVDLSSLSSLRSLNLSGNHICSLPVSIKNLPMLKELLLYSCKSLQSLPELPSSLTDLRVVECTSLEKLTNLPNLLKSLYLDVDGCEKLTEVQELFKLETISNFDPGMIRSLGIVNLESIGNSQLELFNKMTEIKMTLVVQGLYEFGIFSTYIPSCEVPSPFCSIGTDSIVSLTVSPPPDMVTMGLNICFIYARSRSKLDDWNAFYFRVENKTKGLILVYGPTFTGIPGAKEDMTFLCHWKLGSLLDVGDEVNVSVIGWAYSFQIKGFGVGLVYERVEERNVESENGEEKEATQDNTICLHRRSSDYNLSPYQVKSNEYFLSHPEYYMLREVSVDEWARLGLYHIFFGEFVQTEVPTQVGEEDDDDDDSDNYTETESEIDEEMEAEVEELLAAPNWRHHQRQQ